MPQMEDDTTPDAGGGLAAVVGVLGTGVPRPACLLPKAWPTSSAKHGPARPHSRQGPHEKP